MSSRSRPVALVTGASSGIGLELAKVFASEGYDLLISSDNPAKLKKAATQIAPINRTKVQIIVADLSKSAGPKKLYDAVKKLRRHIDVLVNNAGVGVWGRFATETELADELAMIQLNAASVVALTKMFAADMVKRGTGKILITGSEASLAPIALMSIYAATKAFVYSFALSLREELKDSGVTVTALLPGATQTNFFMRAKMEKAKFVREGKMADPADVARDGYKGLIEGDDHIVTPLTDKISATLAKLVPDRMAVQRVE
jgi:short-subunit dehydrogenase